MRRWGGAIEAATLLAMLAMPVGCSTSTPTAPTPARGAPRATHRIAFTRFLAFGDSLTAGTTSPAGTTASAGPSQSYPFQLEALLEARYRDQKVVVENRGKFGERATEAVPRLIGSLRAVNPDMVILLHGANDIAGAGGVAGGLAALAALQVMVHDVRLSGAGVILCTLLPQRAGPSRTADPIVLAGFNEGVRDLARTEGTALADLAQEVDISLIGVDGLHPTEAGYVRMAEVIFTLFRERFEEPPWLH